MEDYYSMLGVSKTASQEEIKKAYRKLAMKHHPDRGGDAAISAKINEAYSVLGDAAKRQQYDNPQPSFSFGGFSQADSFEDIFAQAFGFGRARQRAQRKNQDIKISYTLILQECFTGKEISINYSLPSGGKENLSINIPPGVKPNDTIRFQGYGDDSIFGLPRGDLFLQIRVKNDRHWNFVGRNDLETNITISVFDLITGSDLKIDTPEGKTINLKIPQGTASGTAFSVSDHGLPDSRQNARGKLIIKVYGSIPKINDHNIINKLVDIKHAINKTSK